MNFIILLSLFTSIDLFFVKDTTDLLVRITPAQEIQRIVLYYSFSKTDWDSVIIDQPGAIVDVRLKTPGKNRIKVVGMYLTYDNGKIDDNNGKLYLYEVSMSPRFLMPFAMVDLKVMIERAEKKIRSTTHVDEAITLLEYVKEMLDIVPYVEGSSSEDKRNILLIELESLQTLLGK